MTLVVAYWCKRRQMWGGLEHVSSAHNYGAGDADA